MEYRIEGFEWYLHSAFKDSIAQSRFQQGDVIYRNKPKGKNWEEEIRNIDFLIQVKSPSRKNINTDDDLDVFSSNWHSKVIFEKIYPRNFQLNKTIETTQGRLFTFLWKNDETILNGEKLLPPIIVSLSNKYINNDFIKSKVPKDWCGFATIYNSVNNPILRKIESIENILKIKFHVYKDFFEINQAINLNEVNKTHLDICPTLNVILFLIQSDNDIEIQKDLKIILYKGTKDRFNLKTHGVFIKN